jgi:uncharacterized protein YciI
MTTYYFYLLAKGPRWTAERSPASDRLQADHLGYLAKLHTDGRLVLVGPFGDDMDVRGLGILQAASAEEARGLAEGDPAVKAGHLVVRMHQWMGPKNWFGRVPPPWTELATYYFGFLKRPAGAPSLSDAEAARLQEAHLAYMAAQAREGRLLAAGPFLDADALRGLVIYAAPSLEDALRVAGGDPAVKAGRLVVEMHPWMTARGMLREQR